MGGTSTSTFQTRLRVSSDESALLDAYAELYGRVERTLFAQVAAGGKADDLKSAVGAQWGLTSRQFNAISIGLKGKIESIDSRRKGLLSDSKHRIDQAEKQIKKLGKKPGKETPEAKGKRLFSLHHKKRRLETLKARHAAMDADHQASTVRLAFGSKKLFHAQFDLPANGYDSHAEWLHDWHMARCDQFMVLGSKDETAGCQGCVATAQSDGSLNLRLRLPEALALQVGITPAGKYLDLKGLRFARGYTEILAALASSRRIQTKNKKGEPVERLDGTALTYRFVRDEDAAKGWRVFVSVAVSAPEQVSNAALGAIGIDLNAGHLALSETDRFGNLIHAQRIAVVTYGKTPDQAKAVLGEAASRIARAAADQGKPIVLEQLDFQKKKAQLESSNRKKARMLSSFAYNQTICMIRSAAFKAGVEVIEVNPAFTSVIGAVNHAQQHGISVHLGAALALARRGLGLSERPTVQQAFAPARNGGHVTFELPARNRSKHVWSLWSGTRTRLKAAHAAHFRSGEAKKPPAPLPPGPVPPALGSNRFSTARSRGAKRSQNGSVNVVANFPDVPY